MADEETVGELKETAGELNVEWEIANVFALSEEVDKFYNSPSFHFSGATWYLQIYPNGQSDFESEGYIGIYAVRGDSGLPRSVTYKLSLKRAGGTKENMAEDKKAFEKKHYGWGLAKALQRSNLLQRKSELAPSGVLTIVCSLKQDDTHVVGNIKEPERARVEASTQTEAEHGIVKLSQDLQGLMLSGEDSDLTIRVKGEEFRLHRNILAARTPVFNSMFRHEMTEKTTGIVSIEDCEADTFRKFLDYVYTGTVDKLSPEEAVGLYRVADKYQVSELKEDCLECMKDTLSIDTFCDAVSLALTHDEKELMELAIDLLSNEFVEITGTAKWLNFLQQNPIQANELLRKSFIHRERKN